MSTVSKVVASLATTGVISGVVGVSYFAFKNTHGISDRLKEERFTVLNTKEKGGDWTPILTAYKKETTNTFTGALDENATEDYLKDKCKIALNSKSDDTKNYQLAKQWCVKEESINTILERRKYRVLDTNEGSVTDNPSWKIKFKALLPNTSEFEAVKSTVKEQADDLNIKAIKAGCITLKTSTTKTTSNDFEKNINLAEKWCSLKNSDK